MEKRKYIDLNKIYTDSIETENYKIDSLSLSRNKIYMDSLRSSRDGKSWLTDGLRPDFKYIRLVKKGGFLVGGTMMSDTAMERNTNNEFIQKANGDVLVFGLGLGMIIFPLLKDESVKSITVVELYQDLIDVVLPKIKELDKQNKVTVVQGDCYKYNLPEGRKFDTIYFDIWQDITSDDYKHHLELFKKYRQYLNLDNQNCYMNAWLNDIYRKEIQRSARRLSVD